MVTLRELAIHVTGGLHGGCDELVFGAMLSLLTSMSGSHGTWLKKEADKDTLKVVRLLYMHITTALKSSTQVYTSSHTL